MNGRTIKLSKAKVERRHLLLSCLLALPVVGCSKSNSFSGNSGQKRAVEGTVESAADVTAKSQVFSYGVAAKADVADYLFVLDNSSSMIDDSKGVSDGLAAIAKEVYPASTRFGVITTMAARLDDLTQPHQDIVKYPCIEKEPGFLGLVNSKSLKNFLDCPDDAHLPVAPAVLKPPVVAQNDPGYAAYILEHAKYNAYRLFLNYKKYGTPASRAAFYPMAACDDAWFDPFATNTAGKRCFSAALQNPSYGTGCEPGLLSLLQTIQAQGGKRLFRDNAAVSIIFISDEQLGCSSVETTSGLPSADFIKAAIFANSRVSSVTLHGIVPEDSAALVTAGSRSYVKEIATSGGVAINITDARKDYTPVMKQIISAPAASPVASFVLSGKAKEVTSVSIDGKKIEDFQFDGDMTVRVKGLDPAAASKVEIFWTPAQ